LKYIKIIFLFYFLKIILTPALKPSKNIKKSRKKIIFLKNIISTAFRMLSYSDFFYFLFSLLEQLL